MRQILCLFELVVGSLATESDLLFLFSCSSFLISHRSGVESDLLEKRLTATGPEAQLLVRIGSSRFDQFNLFAGSLGLSFDVATGC